MKRNIFLINCAAAFLWMAMYSYVPTLPAFASSLGATAVMLGVIGGAYGVMQILLRIPLGIVSDKTGKDKLLLIIGFVILTLSAVLFIFSSTVETVVFARGVAGAAAAWWVIISASYAKYNDEAKQVKAQGILSASSSMGKVLAALLGGITAQFFGLRAPFYVALIAALVGLVSMFFLKKPTTRETRTPPTASELLSLLKNKDLMIISGLCIFAQLQCFAVPTYFTSVAAENIGADPGQLGSLTLVYFLTVGLVSLFVGGRFYQRIGGIRVVVVAFVLCAVSCIPFFYHVNLSVIYVMQVVAGIGYGILTSALAGFAIKAVAPHQRSTATGIFQSVYAIGIFVGPVIAGGVIEAVSFDVAYWVVGIITVAAAVLSGVLIPKKYGEM
ncbi:MAG: MFS transporter [Christensenella sp.]|uniref:MFS transporter n=1 Tax=Christensenella sp. TaxID=1935934 RepID=UPI002B1E9B50|nr:MFS transporter [Christensenella sp.]MEA5003614.1 MFS transporter [Christensenella sp.]